MTPTYLGRYEIETILREEPLGRVLRGRLRELNRGVWIGVLTLPPALPAEARERLVHAFEVACRRLGDVGDPRVQHPGDLDRTPDGIPFVVFDLPEAAGYTPLPAWDELDAEEWVRLAVSLCDILQSLREAQIPVETVHPANLFRSEEGRLRYLPLDFTHLAWTARVGHQGLAPGEIGAPELTEGGYPTSTSIVYAVGAWLYGRLTGLSAEELAAHALVGRPPEPVRTRNLSVSDPVCDAVDAALRTRPEERIPTLRAFAAALSPEGLPAPGFATAASGTEKRVRDPLLAAGWWITGALLVTLLGLLCGWVMAQAVPLP